MKSFILEIYIELVCVHMWSWRLSVDSQTETASSVRYLIHAIGQPELHVYIIAQHSTWYHNNSNPPLYTFNSILL